MRPFQYVRAQGVDDAVVAMRAGGKCLAGGTNLIDLMKGDIEQPRVLVDIRRLPLARLTDTPDGGVRIGALMSNSDVAQHPSIRQRYPLLSQALLAGASPQLRNMATVGGNLMQRTRCYYFTDRSFEACNKRAPGSGCTAQAGYNRIHAIFGASEQCVATHPSDMCVALAALDAIVEVRGSAGARSIPLADFHRLPGDSPERDTNLRPDELIVAVTLPPSTFSSNVHYLKVRDRASYAFALVSVAAAVAWRAGQIEDARVVLGGVAHKPWRVHDAERVLIGGSLDESALDAAGDAATRGAQALRDYGFKVELTRRAVKQAVRVAGGRA
jgi:xanthine dehydrogenase YagS FAD-binding subunit